MAHQLLQNTDEHRDAFRLGAPTTDTNIVPEAILVQNWIEELERLVPSP